MPKELEHITIGKVYKAYCMYAQGDRLGAPGLSTSALPPILLPVCLGGLCTLPYL
jgi:hypothetical protein